MSDKVLAKVAGREITEAEFHAYLQGIPREQQAYAMNLSLIHISEPTRP